MRVPKFKVGDKVKVLRKSTEEEHDLWRDSWTTDMDAYIGNRYTILECSTAGEEWGATYPKYSLSNGGQYSYRFPEFVLQKYAKGAQLMLFDL